MPEHIQYEDDEIFNPETHHEQSDVPVRPLLWAVVIFIVFAVFTHIVLGFMYKGFAKMERNRMDPPQTAVARPANADVPQNQPLLQPFPRRDDAGAAVPPPDDTPVTDLQKMRAAEEQALHSYGWVDKQKGIVRIPIEEAKKLLAARIAVQGQTGAVAPLTTTTTTTTDPTTTTAPATTVPAGTPAGSAPSPAPAAASAPPPGGTQP